MSEDSDVAGSAALTICESLLLALNDRNILPEKEIIGVLKDAVLSLEGRVDEDEDHNLHAAAAELIRKVIAGRNTVRRP